MCAWKYTARTRHVHIQCNQYTFVIVNLPRLSSGRSPPAFSFAVIAEPGDGLLPCWNLHDLRELHIRAADAGSGNL